MLKLKRFEEGKWFDYPHAEGVRLKIRPLGPMTVEEYRYRHTKKVAVQLPEPGPDGRTYEIVDAVDEYEYTIALFNHCVEAYEGITIDGMENPGDVDIRRAMPDDIRLQNFIMSTARKLFMEKITEWKEDEKNLNSSQSGFKKDEELKDGVQNA